MWKQKLGIGIDAHFGCSIIEQLDMIKKIGFDAFFCEWNKINTAEVIAEAAAKAKKLGLDFPFIHAPFGMSADLWHGTEEEMREGIDTLKACLDICKANDVPIMVAHTFIGFDDPYAPNEIGLKNYGEVVDYASELGVKIAFENTEGEEYLAALMEHFKGNDTVGYCWDTGHEMCYNHSQDLLALYGDRLLCTHLNDNLGIKDLNGKTTFLDDLHLLPFDGIADWDDIAARLDRHNYSDIMMLEMCKFSKPDRHENDTYSAMTTEEYLYQIYIRACRIAAKRKAMKR